MAYKIKFLERVDTGVDGDEYKPQYHTQSFTDTDVVDIGNNFKAMGLRKVVEITHTGEGNKLSKEQVVELFYPEVRDLGYGQKEKISEKDQKTKDELLGKTKKINAGNASINKSIERLADEEEGKKLKIRSVHMMKDEKLKAKIKEAKEKIEEK